MCGLAGIYIDSPEISEEMLRAMGDKISHRGPDYQGVYLTKDRKFGVVHQRLAIVDLDERANQPMTSDCGNYVIAFNGEIYNHRSIRNKLESLGRRFRTESDTEVLLQAYRQWGAKCLGRFQGMFAFAVWDEANEKLFLARDRIGIKPLYYGDFGNRFFFGSDIKTLQGSDLVPKKIKRKSLAQYLFYGHVPQPNSIYENIFKLLPGHHLTWSPREGVATKQYWDVSPCDSNTARCSDWVEELDCRLGSAVKDRLMSDVPLAAFLSGGLDSSLIVSHMPAENLKTFTIGFEHQSNTLDLGRSKEMAAYRGVENTQTILNETALNDYDSFLQVMDEPFAESSAMALFCNFKAARDAGIKVILSGDGADEVLGGYEYLFRINHFERLNFVPSFAWCGMLGMSHLLLSRFSPASKAGKVRDIYIERSLRTLARNSMSSRHELMLSADNEQDLLRLESSRDELANLLPDTFLRNAYDSNAFESNLQRGLYAEMKGPLVNKQLTKLDKASMANSVEGRVPFLDHELVEFAFRMPDELRTHKRVLKQAAVGRVPQSIVSDRKRGFNVPMHRWLDKYIIRDDWTNLWTDKFDDIGLITKPAVQNFVRQNQRDRKSNFYTLWALHVLRRWLDSNQFTT